MEKSSSQRTCAFEVIVNHRRKILSSTRGFPGTFNDKTIVKFDSSARLVAEAPVYRDLEYEVLDAEGLSSTRKGAWLLVDNGYHRWGHMQMPFKLPSTTEETVWSEMMESMRKPRMSNAHSAS